MIPNAEHVQLSCGGCRVWTAGEGAPLVLLPGVLGAPNWSPFHQALSEKFRLHVLSLPGFPGGQGHKDLDGIGDWLTVMLDLLDTIGVQRFSLCGESVGGMLAAELAAVVTERISDLTLLSPYGIYDADEPTVDLFAQRPVDLPGFLSEKPDAYDAFTRPDPGLDPTEASIVAGRALEASARLLWPLGDLGLRKRLHRLRMPVQLVWGAADRLIPSAYAQRFSVLIGPHAATASVEGAGHLVALDAPEACAALVSDCAQRGKTKG